MKDKTFTEDDIKKAKEKIEEAKREAGKKSNVYSFDDGEPIGEPDIIDIGVISEAVPKKVDWLWKDRIAYGKITLLAGEPGVGKSQLLLYITSIVSQGKKFHLDNIATAKHKVLLIAGEDNVEDTVKPRLMALDADMDFVHYVKGVRKVDKNDNSYYQLISLVDHISELEKIIIKEKYKLIIVDPISLYLGSADENKNKEVRNALSVISALAERHDLAIVLNSHFSKPSGNTQRGAIYRVMGSLGFAAAARVVIAVAKDPEDPTRRLFVPIKNNLSQDYEGLVFKIESCSVRQGLKSSENDLETSRICWLNERIVQTANEILNNPAGTDKPKVEEAKQFLLNLLKDGSMPLAQIRAKAEEESISVSRLYAAKNELKIFENLSFMGKRGKIWSLSANTP